MALLPDSGVLGSGELKSSDLVVAGAIVHGFDRMPFVVILSDNGADLADAVTSHD
ncbi:MAG: hypothetical protein ABSH33_18365 [Steroidobacteraceae bacterium]|jgi:hypothetical protein